MLNWAAQHTPDVPAGAATDAFVDYWHAQPGRNGIRADWPATWRNWLRRDQADLQRRAGLRGAPAQTSSGRPSPVRVDPAEECRRHQGYRAATCGLCRSERIGAEPVAGREQQRAQ